MLKLSLCDYNDAHILVKGAITITGLDAGTAAKQADERDKGAVFKNWTPFTKCISQINNTQVDDTQIFDVIIPIYNRIQ